MTDPRWQPGGTIVLGYITTRKGRLVASFAALYGGDMTRAIDTGTAAPFEEIPTIPRPADSGRGMPRLLAGLAFELEPVAGQTIEQFYPGVVGAPLHGIRVRVRTIGSAG